MIHTIDLHYHAGLERQPGLTLYDYLEHAQVTGRRVLGLTDHYNKYMAPKEQDPNALYSEDQAGLAAYKEEIDSLKGSFPELQLLFCPEIPPSCRLEAIPSEVLEMADYFICEAAYPGDDSGENTDALVERIVELEAFRTRTGKECYIAHPFRSAVNRRLVKAPIEPWVTTMKPRRSDELDVAEVSHFFQLDIQQIAQAAAAHEVPLEINGNTWERVRAVNLPAPFQLLLQSFQILHSAAVQLVPGSDQHGFQKSIGRSGGPVPWEIFALLGVRAADIDFVERVTHPSPEED